MRPKSAKRPIEALECLESRLCLATSVGWDGPGQGAAALTYTLGGAVAGLGVDATRAAVETALNAWASVARVTFTPASAAGLARSIDISFRNIDGPGGTLAIGYYPNDLNREPIAGDIVIDSSETWEVGNARGSAAFDLVLTLVHEIGHALGLDHSAATGSIMAETVTANQSFTGLPAIDVNAIRGLYAATGTAGTTTPVATTPTTTTTPTTATTPTTTTPATRFPTLTWLFPFRRPRVLGRPALRTNAMA